MAKLGEPQNPFIPRSCLWCCDAFCDAFARCFRGRCKKFAVGRCNIICSSLNITFWFLPIRDGIGTRSTNFRILSKSIVMLFLFSSTSLSNLFVRFAKFLASPATCVRDGLVQLQMMWRKLFTLVKFGLVSSSSYCISVHPCVSKDNSNTQLSFSLWVFCTLSSGCLLVARMHGAGDLCQ